MKTQDLESALLRELAKVWQEQNMASFGGSLRPPTLLLEDGAKLGWWRASTRELALQRDLALRAPWAQVVEVLRHEMAHQYAHEVLRATDESAHGPVFRRVCRERGIDARAAGLPVVEDLADDRVARRIRGLLALSNSPNEHEARAAMNRARALLHTHNLELGQEQPGYTFRQVGPVSKRFSPWEKVLSGVLLEHFCVSGIYANAYRQRDASWGRALELLGTPTNVQVAAYVHDVLRSTGASLWQRYRTKHGLSGNAERRRYLLGVMLGFSESLRQQAQNTSTAIVVGKDGPLHTYMRSRYPHIRRGRASSAKVSQATAHGRQDGRSIQIRKGVGEDGAPRRITGPRKG